MHKKRPVNLDLTTIRLPIPALASILHRVSGLIMFLFIPMMLWLCQESLNSEDSFDAIKIVMSSFWLKLFVWGVLSATVYHIIAGIRHLLMDYGLGVTLSAGRLSAKISLGLSILLIIALGVWIWI